MAEEVTEYYSRTRGATSAPDAAPSAGSGPVRGLQPEAPSPAAKSKPDPDAIDADKIMARAIYGGDGTPPPVPGEVIAKAGSVSAGPTARQIADAQTPTSQPQQIANPYATYTQMLERFGPKPKTQEEMETERRRARSSSILGAVGDGIAAMSNLWFAHRDAPYVESKTPLMSERARARWAKIKEANDADKERWMERLMRARQMDEERGDKDKAWRHQLEREKKADEEAARAQAARERQEREERIRWAQQFAYQKGRDAVADARDDRNFKESKRQGDRAFKLQQSSNALQWKQYNDSRNDRERPYYFAFGNKPLLAIPHEQVTQTNLSSVFHLIPDETKKAYGLYNISNPTIDELCHVIQATAYDPNVDDDTRQRLYNQLLLIQNKDVPTTTRTSMETQDKAIREGRKTQQTQQNNKEKKESPSGDGGKKSPSK